MSITAVIENGVVKLPDGLPWTSGSIVRVELVEKELPTLYDAFKEFDGIVDDVPADLSTNIDHYVHGHPRR